MVSRAWAVKVPIALLSITMFACGGAAPPVKLSAAAKSVRVKKADPPSNCQEIGPVTATHGDGCGNFGKKGDYEGAYALLKNSAAAKGANYVRLDKMQEPYTDGKCSVNEFILQGVAFDCPAPPAPAAE
jgi:hypothetical protein